MSNLIQQLETEVQTVYNDDIKPAAALIWNNIKKAVAAGEQFVMADVEAKLPEYVAQLKAIAASAVLKVEQDVNFANLWSGAKYSAALTALLNDVIQGAGVPVAALSESLVAGVVNDMVTLLKTAGPAALMALIQAI